MAKQELSSDDIRAVEFHFYGPRIDALIDARRLETEGATLKNVADNLRSLTVLVAMSVAVAALFKNEAKYPAMGVIGVLWGAWIGWYAILAVAQTGMLCTIALTQTFLGPWLKGRYSGIRHGLTYLLAMITLWFTMGTLVVLLMSFDFLTKNK